MKGSIDPASEPKVTMSTSAGKRKTRRLQPVLRKLRRRQLERNPFRFANPRQVAPHIAALGGEDVERRIVPAERLEDRPEQEGPPARLHPRLRRQLLDAHDRWIGIGAAELVPKLDGCHGRTLYGGQS